jgi:hypothetical protein
MTGVGLLTMRLWRTVPQVFRHHFPHEQLLTPPHPPSRPTRRDNAHLQPRTSHRACGATSRPMVRGRPSSNSARWTLRPPTRLQQWDGDGILTRTFTQEMTGLITASGLPAVEPISPSHVQTNLWSDSLSVPPLHALSAVCSSAGSAGRNGG